MKKSVGLLVIGLFLAIPFTANATLLGWGNLDVVWSGPTAGGYYGDYDGTVKWSDFGYSTDLEVEIFCVSPDHADHHEVVDFYTITPDLDSSSLPTPFSFTNLSQAAWIADNWTTYGTTDQGKVDAQLATWGIMGVVPVSTVSSNAQAYAIYSAAITHTGYETDNWYFAHSPGNGTTANHQDYLTPVSPVPEPATMLMFGVGLIGMVGLGRKKLLKR